MNRTLCNNVRRATCRIQSSRAFQLHMIEIKMIEIEQRDWVLFIPYAVLSTRCAVKRIHLHTLRAKLDTS